MEDLVEPYAFAVTEVDQLRPVDELASAQVWSDDLKTWGSREKDKNIFSKKISPQAPWIIAPLFAPVA